MKIEVALCLPRDVRTVKVVRRLAMTALGELGVTADGIDAIRLALSEACTNVVQHSAAEDEYEVRLVIEDRTCSISVVDTGRGFDASSLARDLPPVDSPGGRGVAMMHALMDGIDFESAPERGTIVHLTKQLELDPNGPLATLLRSSGS